MGKHKNSSWGFEITLPDGWAEPGFLRRILLGHATNPEFYGPSRESIKFAIGPISPVPHVRRQQDNLRTIAARHGHNVLEVGSIEVGGKEHATMICEIPYVGVVKNYSLIFSGIEYLVTARGDLETCDDVVKTFKPA